MNRVLFELSSPEAYERVISPHLFHWGCAWTDSIFSLLNSGENCRLMCVHPSENKIANEIALSVTRDLRLQSYVANGGPSWLRSLIAS